jgi:hypothetical protein
MLRLFASTAIVPLRSDTLVGLEWIQGRFGLFPLLQTRIAVRFALATLGGKSLGYDRNLMINQMKQNDVALSVEFSVINEREEEGEGLILEWKVGEIPRLGQ